MSKSEDISYDHPCVGSPRVDSRTSLSWGGFLTPHSDSSPWLLAEYAVPPSAKLGSPPSDQESRLPESPEEKIKQDKEIQDLFCLFAFIYRMLGKPTWGGSKVLPLEILPEPPRSHSRGGSGFWGPSLLELYYSQFTWEVLCKIIALREKQVWGPARDLLGGSDSNEGGTADCTCQSYKDFVTGNQIYLPNQSVLQWCLQQHFQKQGLWGNSRCYLKKLNHFRVSWLKQSWIGFSFWFCFHHKTSQNPQYTSMYWETPRGIIKHNEFS